MYTVRNISDTDTKILNEVAALEEEIFRDAWSLKEILSTVEQKTSFCRCICCEEEVVGYFLCYYVLDECEIARIAVKNEYRRQGIGQCLFDEMLQGCADMGISKILLDVRAGNVPAIGFYEKNGFSVDGIRRDYYGGENPEDAILMSRIV